MRFLIDEDLPRSVKNLLQRYGHEAFDVRDIGLRGSKDHQVAALAQSKGFCLASQLQNSRQRRPRRSVALQKAWKMAGFGNWRDALRRVRGSFARASGDWRFRFLRRSELSTREIRRHSSSEAPSNGNRSLYHQLIGKLFAKRGTGC